MDDVDRNIKAVLGDKKLDVVESLALDIAYAVVAVSLGKSAASVASMAVAGHNVLSVQKKGVCRRPSCPKPEIQHDRRGRGVPTLT